QHALAHADRGVLALAPGGLGRRVAEVALGEQARLAALQHELPGAIQRRHHARAAHAEARVLDRAALELAALELALEAGLRGGRELEHERLLGHARAILALAQVARKHGARKTSRPATRACPRSSSCPRSCR